MIIYRKLEFSDINDFLNLRKLQIAEEGSMLPNETVDEMSDYMKNHLQDGTFLSYVAVFNNKIIATSGLSIVNIMPFVLNTKAQIGILNSMYCLPEYRRNGIAKDLLQKNQRRCKK